VCPSRCLTYLRCLTVRLTVLLRYKRDRAGFVFYAVSVLVGLARSGFREQEAADERHQQQQQQQQKGQGQGQGQQKNKKKQKQKETKSGGGHTTGGGEGGIGLDSTKAVLDIGARFAIVMACSARFWRWRCSYLGRPLTDSRRGMSFSASCPFFPPRFG
jgi:hypothetical protein